jgi:hypothetical protein
MKITITTVKRASGYRATYQLPGSVPVRYTGCPTRADAIAAAKAGITRTMDTRVPGMSEIEIITVNGK